MIMSSSHKLLSRLLLNRLLFNGLRGWGLTQCFSGFRTTLHKSSLIAISIVITLSLSMMSKASEPLVKEQFSRISGKAVHSLLLDISRLPNSHRLVAVGDRGHILFSDDSGLTWIQAKVPTIKMLTAVAFPSAKNGFAVGHDNLILKTEDAGENWHRVYQDIDLQAPLLDVWFLNEHLGIAVGAYGTILKTKDGGITWFDCRDTINNEDELHYNAIAGDGNGMLYLTGEAGILYRSNDNGNTWITLDSPYEGSLFGVSTRQNEVLVHGLRGSVFRSRNNGDFWQKLPSGTEDTLFGSLFLDDGSSYLVGNSGSILSGFNGRWRFSHRQDRLPITALAKAPDGGIVIVGQGGVQRMNESVDVASVNKIAQSE